MRARGIGCVSVDLFFLGVTGHPPDRWLTTGDADEAAIAAWPPGPRPTSRQVGEKIRRPAFERSPLSAAGGWVMTRVHERRPSCARPASRAQRRCASTSKSAFPPVWTIATRLLATPALGQQPGERQGPGGPGRLWVPGTSARVRPARHAARPRCGVPPGVGRPAGHAVDEPAGRVATGSPASKPERRPSATTPTIGGAARSRTAMFAQMPPPMPTGNVTTSRSDVPCSSAAYVATPLDQPRWNAADRQPPGRAWGALEGFRSRPWTTTGAERPGAFLSGASALRHDRS